MIRPLCIGAPRRGYTLAELLVVMVIMMILVAAILPVTKTILEENRVREASRQLNSYFAMAKARAVQTGRPHGIVMVLQAPIGAPAAGTGTPLRYVRQATQFYIAEVPPPYAGSTQGARGRIMVWPTGGSGTLQFCPLIYDTMTSTYIRDDLGEMQYLISLIGEGELFLVRFNYKGPWYRCIRGIATNASYPNPNNLYYMGSTMMGGATPYPPAITDTGTSNPGYFYQIIRSPRPIGDPLELTAGTCIDMTVSGMGPDGNSFILANSSLAVMFTSSGGMSGFYLDSVPLNTIGTVHFLVGRTNKMNDPVADQDGDSVLNMFELDDSNLADATSLWVSVSRNNGTVTTTQNMPDSTGSLNGNPTGYLADAREAATTRQQMGGR